MYRILRRRAEVKERRDQRKHRDYQKPELLATAPNQVWSWDITKLKGPVKGQLYHLYVIIDIYSRYVVGWLLATTECGDRAKFLFEETMEKQDVDPELLTIHSDRGSVMTGETLHKLYDLSGLKPSFSRPRVSNDNPFSESQFKTMKYCPQYPERFGSIEDAQSFCAAFFSWYNNVHFHSGIKFLTPKSLHYGQAERLLKHRHEVLNKAFNSKPERFVNGAPKRLTVPEAAWINRPRGNDERKSLL